MVDARTGEVLHDQHSDRTLLSTRAHNRMVRYRGYRILHRGGRLVYGATHGLPENVRRVRAGGSRYSQDARQQARVWGNTVREDARAWGDTRRHVERVLSEHTDDRGGTGPFTGRRLPTTTASGASSAGGAPASRPATGTSPAPARPSRPAAGPEPGLPPVPLPRRDGPTPRPSSGSRLGGPVLPGGGSADSRSRQEAAARMRELMRRTAPEAERLRQERERAPRRDEGGEGE